MNGIRIFLSVALTILAAVQWHTVLERFSIHSYTDSAIDQTEMIIGHKLSDDQVQKFRDIENNAPTVKSLTTTATITTFTTVFAWGVTFFAIRRTERKGLV